MKFNIKGTLETSGILFTAGGGFLISVAPPTDLDTKLGYSGLGIIFSLLVFLLAKYIVQTIANRKFLVLYIVIIILLFFSIFFSSTFYLKELEKFTFTNPINTEQKLIVSETYTDDVSRWLAMHPEYEGNHQIIFEYFGDNPNNIWTATSIQDVRSYLMKLYLLVVVLLSVSLAFCIELISKFVFPQQDNSPDDN